MRSENNPLLKNKVAFEQWLNQKSQRHKNNSTGTSREEETIYVIPVVVHVIHAGEAIGVGRNISTQQILSQIEVLNEDFRRMNADAASTPELFQSVAADVEIEFALAQRDPEGLPTNGIVRVEGFQASWKMDESNALKQHSYWPAENYLNIWVTDLSGGFLGYAQFPTTDLIPGLEDSSNSRWTDGVVTDYKAFGSKDKYPPADLSNNYNLGRTTTHEMGHFFGLRHIWGDDSGACTSSDYVDDTPNQGNSTNQCPNAPLTSCGSLDMYQNYMDYTYDACMNLFTLGQKERMRIILDNSPRRASLKDSKGAIPPVLVSNDIGIRRVITPVKYVCKESIIPELQVRNYGTNTISSIQIALRVNGVPLETNTFSLSLNPLEIDTVAFSAVSITTTDNYQFEFEVTGVNNTVDGNIDNNFAIETVTVAETEALPVLQDFNAVSLGQPAPPKWDVINPDELETWQVVNTLNGTPSNKSIFVDFYNYSNKGEYDTLITPVMDFSDISFAVMSFDRAYAKFPGINEDGLLVMLSTNCGQTFDHLLFEAYGDLLATVPAQSSKYIPSGMDDWRRECVALQDFVGYSGIRIAFISKNGFGNNLYIDNIFIDDREYSENQSDIGLASLISPSQVSCIEEVEPVILVKNYGCVTENDFAISYSFNENQVAVNTYGSMGLEPGETIEIILNMITFQEGMHTYDVSVLLDGDLNLENNSLRGSFVINNDEEIVPFREDFEQFRNSNWIIVNGDEEITWETISTNKGTSLYLDSRNYNGEGQDEWLVSPIIDFTATEEATLSFDLAYSVAEESKDGLTIRVSTNCGVSYDDIIFSRFGQELSTGEFSDIPQEEKDWSRIDLNMLDYLGEEDVRIAFIANNFNGNNIFIDNIQSFITPFEVIDINEIYPNPSDGIFNITFDLPERETVNIIIYDIKGQVMREETLENILNQTYTFDMREKSQGIYLVKVTGQSINYVKRIFLRP